MGRERERELQCDLQSEAEASGSLLEFHHLHEFEAASLLVYALRCFRGESCFYYPPCRCPQAGHLGFPSNPHVCVSAVKCPCLLRWSLALQLILTCRLAATLQAAEGKSPDYGGLRRVPEMVPELV